MFDIFFDFGMKIIKIKQNKILDEQINLIVDYFRRGKVVVYPTDTIYGIGCIATDRKAINRIYKIKKRDEKIPLLVLVSSLAMVKRYCYVSKRQEEYLRNVWKKNPPNSPFAKATEDKPPLVKGGIVKNSLSPSMLAGGGSVSVILKSRGVLPKELAGGMDSLAVRLPNNQLLVRMIREVNAPIVSTSLNISGRKNLANVSKIERYFKSPNPALREGRGQPPFAKGGNSNKGLPDLAVDIGELNSKSSKLVDLTDINNIKILRK